MKPTLYSLYSFCIGFLSSRATALQNMVSRGRNGVGSKECCHNYLCTWVCNFSQEHSKRGQSPLHSQHTTKHTVNKNQMECGM